MNITVYKKITVLWMLLFSGNVFALRVDFKIPISIEELPQDLFTQVRLTGYLVDAGPTPIPINAPTLTQGQTYQTPMLDLGDHNLGEIFYLRLLGEIRARNSMPGAEDVIVPFRVRLRVYFSSLTNNNESKAS